MSWPRCPKCKDGLVGAIRTVEGRSRWCCAPGCDWRDFEPDDEIAQLEPNLLVFPNFDTRPPVPIEKQDDAWTTLIGRFDNRPGNYYVVAHPEHKRPHECFWLIAGPYTSHRVACEQLQHVRDIVGRLDPARAFGMRWVTARTEVEDVRSTSLGLGQRRDVGDVFRDGAAVGKLPEAS